MVANPVNTVENTVLFDQSNSAVKALQYTGLTQLVMNGKNTDFTATELFDKFAKILKNAHEGVANLNQTYAAKVDRFVEALIATSRACAGGSGTSPTTVLVIFKNCLVHAKAAFKATPRGNSPNCLKSTKLFFITVWIVYTTC